MVNPDFSGLLCPPTGLNPSRDDSDAEPKVNTLFKEIREKLKY